MIDVDFLPEHLIKIGGSYIGLEFAQMYRRFGSRVTVVEMGPRLIVRKDEDVSDAIREIRENEAIEFRTGASCICVENQDGKIVLNADCDEGAEKIIGSHIPLTVGRKPNTDGLGLDKAGVEIDERSDVNGRGAFTHTY